LRSSHTNGVSVDYSYDELNRLKTVLDNRLTAGANTSTYVYSPTSTLKSTTLPNGVVTSYGYNTLDRLTSLLTKKNTTTLASYSYTLRAEGNRSQVVELGGRTVVYGYDNAYRLSSETISGGSVNGTISYGYDAVGNRTSRTSTVAGIPTVAPSTYDANDRLNGNTYNNNGDTTVAGGITYGYDFRDKLTSATGGIAMLYDGDGNRISQTAGGTTTQYLVDDLNPTGYPQVVEELVSGVVQRSYTYGHSLISQTQVSGSPTTSFYGTDGLGSVRHLSNTSGTKTNTYDYDAFGTIIAGSTPTANSYLFTGEQFDANLGLYYLRARYYNQGGGRFWSRDTSKLVPGTSRELNRYVYTANDPVNAIDPSGRNLAELFEQFKLDVAPVLHFVGRTGWAIRSGLNGPEIALRAKFLVAILTGLEGYTAEGELVDVGEEVTIALGNVSQEGGDITEVIAINGGRYYQMARDALIAEGIPANRILELPEEEPYLHAEEVIKSWADAAGYDLEAIGISNVAGPCPPCRAMLDQSQIPAFWLKVFIPPKWR